jgi:hypothetical protein
LFGHCDCDGRHLSHEGAPTEKLPGGKFFMEKYNAQKYDNPPEAYGAFAYAAMDMILNAIEINFGIGGARCLLRVYDDAFYALASPNNWGKH